ncbi:MAG: acyl-CoA thioesterase [Gammaproteobacteria bacterium]|nr:acyl-CoA thioesterase [Gammaproteobacteria bacterium]
MVKQEPGQRDGYRHFLTITTRWMDNDIYGHINNVQYYSYFDTVINRFLIEHGVLDIHSGEVIGLAVESHCNYFSSAAFPDDIEAGLRVAHLGRSSVRYEVGLFVQDRDSAVAQGHFVHVYVDRQGGQPVGIPENLRSALSILLEPA